jgi:hypothetical protein
MLLGLNHFSRVKNLYIYNRFCILLLAVNVVIGLVNDIAYEK